MHRRINTISKPSNRMSLTWVALAASLLAAGTIHAGPLTFVGASGDLAAKAEFVIDGPDLIITLTNTSSADVLAPSDVLTAVFFDLDPHVTLHRISAVVGAGSVVHFGSTDPGGVVGGEWAFRDDLSGAPGSAGVGVSSTGVNLFGPDDLFPGSNLQGPDSPNGLEYGITSAGDNVNTGNWPVTGKDALIQNQVVFTLRSASGLDLDPETLISNVTFQYGTSLSEPRLVATFVPPDDPDDPDPPIEVIPEPGTAALMGLACVLIKGSRRFNRQTT